MLAVIFLSVSRGYSVLLEDVIVTHSQGSQDVMKAPLF